jgi:hypothetical protein
MKMNFSTFVLAVALAASGGCISSQKTTYRDTERMKVEFENDTAGRLFYETLSNSGHNRNESNTKIEIPIVFEHKQHTVDGENFLFNFAVRRCDSNGDGKITETEARIFSKSAGK